MQNFFHTWDIVVIKSLPYHSRSGYTVTKPPRKYWGAAGSVVCVSLHLRQTQIYTLSFMPEGRSFRKQENSRPASSYRLSSRDVHYFLRSMMYRKCPYATASHFTQKQLYSRGQL